MQSQFQKQLNEDPDLQSRYQELKQINMGLTNMKQHQPSQKLRQNFYRFLELEKAKVAQEQSARIRTVNLRWMLGIAAGLLVLVTSYFVFQNYQNKAMIRSLNKELVQSKEYLMNQLKSESTALRVQAVNHTYQLKSIDPEIQRTLISTFESDPSPIVRLTALEALSNYTDEQTLKRLLIDNLPKEKDASIQISMIHLLTRIKVPDALKSFENLLLDDSVMEAVKGEAQMGIYKINSYQKM